MDYIYEELDPAQVAEFETALEKCPECQEKLEAFQRTRAVVSELEDLAPPPSITAMLLEEAARAAPAEKVGFAERLRRMMRVFIMHPAIAAAATLVLVLGVSFLAYRKGVPPAKREPIADSPPLAAPAGASSAPGKQQAAADREGKASGGDKAAAVAAGSAAPAQDPAREPTTTTGKDLADQKAQQAQKANQALSKLQLGNKGANISNNKPKGGLRTSGPVAKRGYLASTRDERKKLGESKRARGASSSAVPGSAGGKLGKAADVLQTKRRPRRRSLYRRTRRRAANTLDVGGGGAGVWGGRARYRYKAPSKPAAQPRVARRSRVKTEARKNAKRKSPPPAPARQQALRNIQQQQRGRPAPNADDADRSDKKSKKKRASVASLLGRGHAAVASGRCKTALALYFAAFQRRPSVVRIISARIGRCLGALRSSSRYTVLAARVNSVRNPRRRRTKRRAKQRAPKRAAPAKRNAY